MVWYTRESKELMTIYENLNKRFKREHEHTERLLESREEWDEVEVLAETERGEGGFGSTGR